MNYTKSRLLDDVALPYRQLLEAGFPKEHILSEINKHIEILTKMYHDVNVALEQLNRVLEQYESLPDVPDVPSSQETLF